MTKTADISSRRTLILDSSFSVSLSRCVQRSLGKRKIPENSRPFFVFQVIEIISQLKFCSLFMPRRLFDFSHKLASEEANLEKAIYENLLSRSLV